MATKKTVTEEGKPKARVYDFTKIPLKNIIDKEEEQDLSKVVGNCYYNSTADIGQMDKAREIYHKGKTEFTEEERSLFEQHILKSELPGVIKLGIQEFFGKEDKNGR